MAGHLLTGFSSSTTPMKVQQRLAVDHNTTRVHTHIGPGTHTTCRKRVCWGTHQFMGTLMPAARAALQGAARAPRAPAATCAATRDEEHAVSMLSAGPCPGVRTPWLSR